MAFEEFEHQRQFHEAWSAVKIARPVHYSLFTFGESCLPYFLVCGKPAGETPVSITKGEVRVQRPLIITRENTDPEFHNFFESTEQRGVAEFLLARTAHFSNLKFDNQRGGKRIVHDHVESVVAGLNRQLDDQEEDRIAVLIAPTNLGGVALLRYVAERVWQSGPENIQELRERGFLP